MEIPFPLASSQVSMAAEMDSAPQAICDDKNHHFSFEYIEN